MCPPANSSGVTTPDPVRVWLLGDFRVSVGSWVIQQDKWRLRKAAALVKLLALAPNHRLNREQAMDLLWPDSGKKSASNGLRQVLYAARRVLDPASSPHRYLVLQGEQLVLCPEGDLWVDVNSFEEAALAARNTHDTAVYRAAIDLYAGDLLPGDRYEGWAETKRAELRQLFLSLLLELAGLYEERDEHALAIEALRMAVAQEATLEEAHAPLMRIYALSGKPEQALAEYERLRDTLYSDLGTEPSATTRRLRDEIAAGNLSSARPVGPPQEEDPPDEGKHNLPNLRTSFVGREREKREVERALSMTRLLTLTGVGGSGKTRLATEVARDLLGSYPDGLWMVELASLSDGELVPQALAATLSVREQPGRHPLEALLDALRDKQMLLILDNCEHLIDAAARLADTLLESCPHLRTLATSREPLGVRGELVWSVPPLSTPGTLESATVEELEGYESARLLAARASTGHPDFKLTVDNAEAVAQVCTRMEGIPLAIELAAARIGVLSAEQISERLGHSLKVLTGGDRTADPRHRTLRATLDWSYELLGDPEQALFRRISVFAGGFTLEAAENVGAGGSIKEDDVLELISTLVEKSLVMAEESWERGARYKLLEPVRQYSQEKLEESGEKERTRYQHADWYLTLAEEADKESSGPGHVRWLRRLESEHDNLRAALDWLLGKCETELALRLVGALWLFWFTRGYLIEGRGWLEKAISLGGSPVVRAKALNGAGWIVMFQGDFATAKSALEESLILYRELNDEEGIASSLSFLGHVALLGHRDDIPVGALLEEALTLKPRLENRRTIANMLLTAGIAAGLLRNDLGDAAALFEESRALYREMDDTWGLIACLVNLGLISVILEHHTRAKALLREVMRLSGELKEKVGSVHSFFGLACVAASEGHPVRAARLWGVSQAVQEAAGVEIMPSTYSVTRYESRLAEARTRLGEAAFEEAWAEGKAMTPEESVEYALSEEEPATTAAPLEEASADEQAPGLTRREQGVALLVAAGLTNRQIATELSISERTAGNHVAKILGKLELRSRAQIAVWASEQKLLDTTHG